MPWLQHYHASSLPSVDFTSFGLIPWVLWIEPSTSRSACNRINLVIRDHGGSVLELTNDVYNGDDWAIQQRLNGRNDNERQLWCVAAFCWSTFPTRLALSNPLCTSWRVQSLKCGQDWRKASCNILPSTASGCTQAAPSWWCTQETSLILRCWPDLSTAHACTASIHKSWYTSKPVLSLLNVCSGNCISAT